MQQLSTARSPSPRPDWPTRNATARLLHEACPPRALLPSTRSLQSHELLATIILNFGALASPCHWPRPQPIPAPLTALLPYRDAHNTILISKIRRLIVDSSSCVSAALPWPLDPLFAPLPGPGAHWPLASADKGSRRRCLRSAVPFGWAQH